MAAISPTDAWAVGGIDGNPALPLIEHWDGRRWNSIAIPEVWGPLYGVSAHSARDVWAVGRRVILHWDGSRWARVRTSGNAELYGVVALSARDVWVVGDGGAAFVTHWDGRRWRPNSSLPFPPFPDAQDSHLTSIAAAGPSDVWAVGDASGGDTVDGPISYHWNGERWKLGVGFTEKNELDGGMTGIAARSKSDVWAVGWYDPPGGDPSSAGPGRIWRWTGRSWNEVAAQPRRFLKAISTDTRGKLWAVGSVGNPLNDYNGPSAERPFIERYGC